MTQRLRIFISSPSDVRPERLITQRVIERLAREFEHYFGIEPVLWEREPLIATEHFQSGIIPPSQAEIVVVILWSRLGSLLPADQFTGAITGREVTGTEWEFEEAVAAYRQNGKPDILFYRKQAQVMASLEDDAELERQRDQKRRAEDFYRHWFLDEAGGSFKAASHTFTDPAAFEEMLETHLRELIRDRIADTVKLTTAIRWHKGNPFRGLQSFEIEHAPVFFGRTRARNELRETLARQDAQGCAFVLVFGASGSGKSSLVKAGLLPDITLPGMIDRVGLCRYAIMRPSDQEGDVFGGLAGALLKETALPELHRLQYEPANLAEILRDPPKAALPIRQGLARARETAQLTERAQARLAVVVDQFEELFTRGHSKDQQRDFVAALAALARSGNVWVIATMRSDFFDRLETLPELVELSKGDGRYLLTPPSAAEIGQIIRQPAQEAGLRFEVQADTGIGLDEELRQVASRDPAALPLLEFTLDQLWQRRTESGMLTFKSYDELGGMEGALGQRAEEVFSAQPKEVQDALPVVLRALVTVGEGKTAEPTARNVSLTRFPEGTPSRRLIEAMLDPQARLLIAEGNGEGTRVRIAHEALLSHWERAAGQIDADRADLQTRARLEQAARRWRDAEEKDKKSLLLQPGLPLSEGADLLARRRVDLDAETITFIEISQAAYQQQLEAEREAQRRKLHRTRWIAGIMGFLAIVAIIGGIFGYVGWDQAITKRKLAVAQRLAVQADAALDQTGEGLERSLLLAVESLESTWTREGYGAWARAVALAPRRPDMGLETGGVEILDLSVHPHRPWVAVLGQDGWIRVLDYESGREVRALEGRESPPRSYYGKRGIVRFSPDGRWLGTVRHDRLTLWDTKTPEWSSTDLPFRGEGYFDLAFDPDGKILAAGGYAMPLRLYETGSWGRRAEMKMGSPAVALGRRWLAAANFNGVGLWSMEDLVGAFGDEEGMWLERVNGELVDLALDPEADWLVAVNRQGARFWRLSLEEVLARSPQGTMSLPPRTNFTWAFEVEGLDEVAVSRPEGRYLALSGTTVYLLETGDGREIARIFPGGIAEFTPDGRQLVLAGDKLAVWEIPEGGSAGRIELGSPVESVVFDPQGRWLAAGQEDGTLLVFAVGGDWTSEFRRKLGGRIRRVGFSPGGGWLVAETGGPGLTRLHVLQTRSWEPVSPMEHEAPVSRVAFSPDGRYLATYTPGFVRRGVGLVRASRTRIWSSADGEEIAWRSHEEEDLEEFPGISWMGSPAETVEPGTLPLGQGGRLELLEEAPSWPPLVGGRDRSPDGRWLADPQGVSLKEPGTGRLIVSLQPESKADTLDFDPQGRWLATGRGRSVDLWLLGPVEALIDEGCARLSRNLGEENQRQYLDGAREPTCPGLPVP